MAIRIRLVSVVNAQFIHSLISEITAYVGKASSNDTLWLRFNISQLYILQREKCYTKMINKDLEIHSALYVVDHDHAEAS